MRYHQIINEHKMLLDNGSEIQYLKNPAPNALISFCNKSSGKSLRGVIDGDDLFWWDASQATHYQGAMALGINYNTDYRAHFVFDDGIYIATWVDDEWILHPNNKGWRILMSSDKIYFDAGSHGYLSGPEYLEYLS